MKVSPNGFDYSKKDSSFKPIVVDEFRKKILEGIKNSKEISPERGGMKGFGAFDRVKDANLDEPDEIGWTFLINKKNTLGEQIIEAISTLARYRRMDGTDSPLLFNDTPARFWDEWIKQYEQLRKGKFKKPPKYILIVGSPDSIPFGFQSRLSRSAFVGRLDFDDIREVKSYAERIVRIEASDESLVNREVTFFATDHGVSSTGCYDPTHFSRYDIEKELVPTVDVLHEEFGLEKNFKTNKLIAADATKRELIKSIQDSKPGLVYASSWGMCAPGEQMDLQKMITGAICCQGDPSKDSYKDLLLTAGDIPSGPFLEGGVFFQHSSFSYGAPASSDLHTWISEAQKWDVPEQNAPTSFVSSLPKKMVLGKNGPLAFIGHLDEMLSYTFAPGESFDDEDRRIRLKPISNAIEHILLGRPVGYALGSMTQRLGNIDAELADLSAALHAENRSRSDKEDEPYQLKTLSDKFLERHEAKNYMIFGDPAVRIGT